MHLSGKFSFPWLGIFIQPDLFIIFLIGQFDWLFYLIRGNLEFLTLSLVSLNHGAWDSNFLAFLSFLLVRILWAVGDVTYASALFWWDCISACYPWACVFGVLHVYINVHIIYLCISIYFLFYKVEFWIPNLLTIPGLLYLGQFLYIFCFTRWNLNSRPFYFTWHYRVKSLCLAGI